MKTALSQHCGKWAKGCGSTLCGAATKICLVRGTRVPCDVLFVGEAPGPSEDVIGEPFVGPSGQLLDCVVAATMGDKYSYAMTNLVGCIPTEDGRKAEDGPPEEAVKQCSGRLKEFIKIADGWPAQGKIKLMVLVGKNAATFLTPGYMTSIELHRRIPYVSIVHPGWAVRQNSVIQQSYATKSAVTINVALDNIDKLAEQQKNFAQWSNADDIPF